MRKKYWASSRPEHRTEVVFQTVKLPIRSSLNYFIISRQQTFFEYQAMLAAEYAALDPQRLLQLLVTVAGDAFAAVEPLLGAASYRPYRDTLQAAIETVRQAAAGSQTPGPLTIDQCQKELTAAHRNCPGSVKCPILI